MPSPNERILSCDYQRLLFSILYTLLLSLNMASLWTWIFSGWGAAVLFLIITIVLLAKSLVRVLSKIRRSDNIPRSGTLKILSEGANVKFECAIIARSICMLH